jgi:hypothetical protein
VSQVGQAGVGLIGVGAMNKKALFGACVLVLCGSVASGEEFTSGDWTWSIEDPEMYYAVTENSAGQVLMQMCDTTDSTCVYVVGFDTTCEEGASYPALVNTDNGASSIEFLCGAKLKDDTNLMLIQGFDQIDGIVRKARRIGFALPMQGDEFKAIRFSLKGSVAAMDAMRKVAAGGAPAKGGAKKVKDSEVF